MANIGVLGGTFDPIHNGHLMLGRQAYQEYGLDEVWFMPSGTPPHKKDHEVTCVEDRCEMVRLAIEAVPFFRLSRFEIQRSGNTYTAETLRLLNETYTQNRFYFIIGADSLFQIETWYHPREVMSQAILLVAGREYPEAPRSLEEQITYLKERYPADIRLLHGEEVDLSSSELRDMIARKKHVYKYLPQAVEDYIRQHALYQQL